MISISPVDRRQAAIEEGEAAWVSSSTGKWEETSWMKMGTALTLIREDVLRELHINNPRGGSFPSVFGQRLAGTKFKTMDPSTRSHLLFCMEPENRIVLDRLLAAMPPSDRARRTHPTTLYKMIRAEMRPAAEKAADAKKRSPAERIKELEAEVASLKRQQSDGGLFDYDRNTVDDIARVLISHSRPKAERLAKAVQARLKKGAPAG